MRGILRQVKTGDTIVVDGRGGQGGDAVAAPRGPLRLLAGEVRDGRRARVALGAVAGAATLTGVAMLVYRRRTTGPVFMATAGIVLAAGVVFVIMPRGIGGGILGDMTTQRAGSMSKVDCAQRRNGIQ